LPSAAGGGDRGAVRVLAPQRRERIEPTENWQQLALRVESAGQRGYELSPPRFV
jgi:hypothetical protein